jgi:hypothetical protein
MIGSLYEEGSPYSVGMGHGKNEEEEGSKVDEAWGVPREEM